MKEYRSPTFEHLCEISSTIIELMQGVLKVLDHVKMVSKHGKAMTSALIYFVA
jgi:hypothetical protein